MSKFTQGTWKVKELLTDWGVFAVNEGKCEPVAECLNKADARLIAQAPRMYELLQESFLALQRADTEEPLRLAIDECLCLIDGEVK